MELTNGERRVIKFLMDKDYVPMADIFKSIDKNEVTSSISWLREKKIVTVIEKPVKFFVLGQEGKKVMRSGLPEEKLLAEYRLGIRNLEKLDEIMGDDLRYALAQVFRNGGQVIDGQLVIKDEEKLEKYIGKVKETLAKAETGSISEEEAQFLKPRKGFIAEKVKMERVIKLTSLGKSIDPADLQEKVEINQVTPEIIDKYDETMFLRPYDPTLYAPRFLPGKIHPLSEFISEVRDVMIEMGFEELRGHIVETAFWDMDILFIPQDHPAREMQDTFYLKGIEKLDQYLVKKVKRVHEKGIGSSRGWQYSWSEEEASRLLLRTHTTVNTIRYLVQNPGKECKIFSVEKIFRRENVDSSHLPEFFQVEGVIAGKGVTFGVLIDTLVSFYEKIGVKEVRVKPSYFPYTEPSLEIYGRFLGKEIELGGAGMFRPEVLKPWNIKYNVAAWGLGLERLLMMILGLDDIRDIYRNDLLFLEERKILKNVL
jgi:phenylalanyl-tRNA synthetase alpha chain